MKVKFILKGRLPTLNDFIEAERKNRYKGAAFKGRHQAEVEWLIPKMKVKPPVILHYTWYEANSKRDLDNVAGFGHKIIQDALVKRRILPNDSPKEIVGFTDTFKLDRKNPRIEVEIEEV